MTHPNSTANQWSATAAAAATAAARLERRMRIRFRQTPRKPLNIAEWNLGSSLTEPVFTVVPCEFKVFLAVGPPSLCGGLSAVTADHGIRSIC